MVHHWQYYDRQEKEWLSVDKLSFEIEGGRQAGYKGYSFKSNLLPGAWRIYVENERGQVLGRIKFNVEISERQPYLKETIR